ncbi:MAG: type VI secretion system baseplate subunit TssE [Alphaproteobacteria bacterium]
MARSWAAIGSSAPLFDRLIDNHPEVTAEASPFMNYDKAETIESIMREAEALLNTRCKMPLKEYLALDPANLDYGVPDLYGFPDQSYGDASNSDGAGKLARMMANSLKLFEPRLADVSVEIRRYDEETQNLYLHIEANLKVDEVLEPISFPVSIQNFQDIGKREKKAYTKT